MCPLHNEPGNNRMQRTSVSLDGWLIIQTQFVLLLEKLCHSHFESQWWCTSLRLKSRNQKQEFLCNEGERLPEYEDDQHPVAKTFSVTACEKAKCHPLAMSRDRMWATDPWEISQSRSHFVTFSRELRSSRNLNLTKIVQQESITLSRLETSHYVQWSVG